MSRPTTSQIIAKGDYLQSTFDPSTLTIPHLIGIFTYHQIAYPTQHNKAKLIEVFEREIKARGEHLRKQRLERQDTAASGDGVFDGVTGHPVSPVRPAELPTRRSSRRLSKEPEAQRPDPPKRRRSSAAPTLGRATAASKSVITPIPVSEESEEEEEPINAPARKVGRNDKDSESAGTSSRRVSQKFGPGTDDSGWEDNNIFQSGAESSSPVRPVKTKTTRKSSTRKARSSLSAPPEIDSSPTQKTFSRKAFVPPQSKFEPALPANVSRTRARVPYVKQEPEEPFIEDDSAFADVSADISREVIVEVDDEEQEPPLITQSEEEYIYEVEDSDEEREGEEDMELHEDKATAEISRRIAGGGSDAVARRRASAGERPTPLWQRLFTVLLTLALASIVGQYKMESAPIGYCDTGKNTNAILKAREAERREIEGCHAQRVGESDPDACPPLPLIPLPHPQTCTPCPAHATCTRTDVMCDDGYIKSPHPFALVPYLPEIANGLPALGPIAFPPRCIVDPIRKRSIGQLGKAVDYCLAKERGDRVCRGVPNEDGGDAVKWGIEVGELKELMKSRIPADTIPKGKDEPGKDNKKQPIAKPPIENFDRLFGEAVDQLMKLGRVVQGFDSNGKVYFASDHYDLSLSCRATVAARNAWLEWRSSVLGTLALIGTGWFARRKIANRRIQDRHVAELVQITLDALRSQEMAHHVDPVTAPYPYLSSLQLRDYVLQDEHSIPARQKLWERVERVVEGNANVRANLEELHGGDEARVWRWVGTTSGLVSPRKGDQQGGTPFRGVERIVA